MTWLRLVVFLYEAADCGLQVDKHVEYAVLKPATGKFGGSDKEMAGKIEILQPIPGIGPGMGWMLLGHMPELGKAGDKQIAALAGVAPFAHDSGRTNRKRFVQMGRRALRNALYQAALVATRYNLYLKQFAARLKGR